MKYDPIKESLGNVFNKNPMLRILFYRLLDLLLLRAWHIKKELREISKIKGKGTNVLDAGCGFGQYSYFLSRVSKEWKIVGVEIKDEQVADCNQFFKQIKKEQQVSFQKADLTNFSHPDSYDLILSVDVMEHIEEDVQVFKNFYQSLKCEGILLISTPSDQGGSDVHQEGDVSFIEEHVRDGYNMDEIKNKLSEAGFKNVEARYSYGNPGKISWLFSMKYPIIILNISKLFFIILPFYYMLILPFCLLLNALDVKLSHRTGTGLIVKAYKH